MTEGVWLWVAFALMAMTTVGTRGSFILLGEKGRLPPALQRIYPALVSQCIIVMLGSSVVSQVSYEELTFAANLIQSRTFLSFEVYLVTTGIYLALSITLRQLMMAAGRKWLGVQA